LCAKQLTTTVLALLGNHETLFAKLQPAFLFSVAVLLTPGEALVCMILLLLSPSVHPSLFALAVAVVPSPSTPHHCAFGRELMCTTLTVLRWAKAMKTQ
jgi:hypothetical protein